MKNNNLIPSLLIACGLFAVALKPAPQPAPIPQAEPVAVAAASFTGPSEPVIVWYGTDTDILFRAWSDGTIEAKNVVSTYRLRQLFDGQGSPICDIRQWDPCIGEDDFLTTDWFVISSAQMACRTDINGNGEIEFGDLLAVLNQWGDQATCPDTVQLQCGLMEMN